MELMLQSDDPDLVKALIVFGADVNGKNQAGHSPRHIAATSQGIHRLVTITV